MSVQKCILAEVQASSTDLEAAEKSAKDLLEKTQTPTSGICARSVAFGRKETRGQKAVSVFNGLD
jgi:hypothetical protein